MMKFATVFTLFMVLTSNQIKPSVSQEHLCRRIHTVTRCVEARIVKLPESWCSFHMCGPNWILAKQCPAGETQATHRCKSKIGPADTWVCDDVLQIKPFMFPIGCTAGQNCTKEVRACRCNKRLNQDKRQFTHTNPIPAPNC